MSGTSSTQKENETESTRFQEERRRGSAKKPQGSEGIFPNWIRPGKDRSWGWVFEVCRLCDCCLIAECYVVIRSMLVVCGVVILLLGYAGVKRVVTTW